MKINQYKIEVFNLMTPLDNEYLLKILKEQMQYLERKGIIENTRMMISVDNMDKKTVNIDSNMVREK